MTRLCCYKIELRPNLPPFLIAASEAQNCSLPWPNASVYRFMDRQSGAVTRLMNYLYGQAFNKACLLQDQNPF